MFGVSVFAGGFLSLSHKGKSTIVWNALRCLVELALIRINKVHGKVGRRHPTSQGKDIAFALGLQDFFGVSLIG